MKRGLKEIAKGIVKENPVFVQALGLCPTLAVSSSIANGLGMGLATTFVLTFVTIADLVMHAFQPELHRNLGIFVPLIVVNCIILGRVEAFSSKHGVAESTLDALGMGLGFTGALLLIGFVRELLGAGQLLGRPVLGGNFEPMLIMVLPPGAFLTIGLYLGLFRVLGQWRRSRSGLNRGDGP